MNYQEFISDDEAKDFYSLTSSQAQIEFLRNKFFRSFPALVYLLGYKDIGQCHRDKLLQIAKQPDGVPQRRLWLWSRGHFKTSLITEAKAVYRILNNPNIRILIVSNTLDVSKSILKNIKDHFIRNQDFRKFFPDYCPKENKDGKIEFGTTESFTVPNRTKVIKEPTVMCAGIGTNLTGYHFDEMYIDDLVTKDSVSNDTQIKASKDYYAALRQLFDNPTIPVEDIVGTPYHFNDIYQDILKNPEFEISLMPAIIDGKSTFYERFSLGGLEAIKNDPTVGPYQFSSQYLLNPINPADAKFKDEWLKYYDKLPEGLSEYLLCDPASTQKKKSDFTVIQLWGVDSEENHYLLDGIRDKLKSNERVEKYVSFAKNSKRLKRAKYEVLGGRHGDLENIRDRFISEKIHISPTETKSTNATKTDRIEQRLVGQFHAGKIFLPRSLPYRSVYDGKTYDFVKEYKLEYLQFPFSEHDDILDCHSQMFDGDFITKGEISIVKVEKRDEFEWWRQLAIKSKKTENKRYIFGMKNKIFSLPAQKSFR